MDSDQQQDEAQRPAARRLTSSELKEWHERFQGISENLQVAIGARDHLAQLSLAQLSDEELKDLRETQQILQDAIAEAVATLCPLARMLLESGQAEAVRLQEKTQELMDVATTIQRVFAKIKASREQGGKDGPSDAN
jgi:hypothetical protein